MALGGNYDQVDNQGNTPLHLLVQSKEPYVASIAKKMLMRGASNTAKNHQNNAAKIPFDLVN